VVRNQISYQFISFVQDRLHLNDDGYRILAAIVRKHVK